MSLLYSIVGWDHSNVRVTAWFSLLPPTPSSNSLPPIPAKVTSGPSKDSCRDGIGAGHACVNIPLTTHRISYFGKWYLEPLRRLSQFSRLKKSTHSTHTCSILLSHSSLSWKRAWEIVIRNKTLALHSGLKHQMVPWTRQGSLLSIGIAPFHYWVWQERKEKRGLER